MLQGDSQLLNFFSNVCHFISRLVNHWQVGGSFGQNIGLTSDYACYDDPSPEMEVDDVVFVKSQLWENVNCPGNIKLH